MERSRIEVDRLYDTTVVEADILLDDPTVLSTGETPTKGRGFVYQQTIESVLNSGFVISRSLEADVTWREIGNFDTGTLSDTLIGYFPVYAYDSPEAFYAGLADPGSLGFAAGWDMERFAQPRTMDEIQQDGVPVIFPTDLLEPLQLEVGDGADHRSIHKYLPLRHRWAVLGGELSRCSGGQNSLVIFTQN